MSRVLYWFRQDLRLRDNRCFIRACDKAEAFLAVEQSPEPMLRLAQTPQAVFNDNHRAIDDQPEIECTQTHQIGRGSGLHHAGQRHQHRYRNHRRRNQCRADIAEQQEQDNDNKQCAFEQVFSR